MKRSLVVLLAAVSLSACAQTSPPAVAASQARRPAKPRRDRPWHRRHARRRAVARCGQADQSAGRHRPDRRRRRSRASSEVDRRRPGAVRQRRRQVPDAGRRCTTSPPRRTLGEASMAQLRSRAAARRSRSATASCSRRRNPKYTVTVFTDVECGYCRKLHSADRRLQPGRASRCEYLAFPRMGLGSPDFTKMVVGLVRGRPQEGAHRRQERPPGAVAQLQEPGDDGIQPRPARGPDRHADDPGRRRHPARRLRAAGATARRARSHGRRRCQAAPPSDRDRQP